RVVAGGGPGWTQARLPHAARAAGIDVYFSPIPVLPMLLRMPCPCVVTVHDLLEFRDRWWYFSRLIGRTLERSAGVICVSEATAAEVRDAFPSAGEQLRVVREAADASVFHQSPDPAGARDELFSRLGIDSPPILAVGTIQPRKNYARLIEAYARATADRPGSPPLVIVGRRGWEYEDVLQSPGRFGVEGRVVFAGQLEDVEVGILMRSSLMLAAVSTAEGFGLPLVEAMYSGLPALASDIPPFREVAGNAARFVNPLSTADIEAGLRVLLDNVAARRELALAGEGRRQLFSWDRASADVCSILWDGLTRI
ncbi:MAG: glycosyltransferase family 4 protein, partial [Candidatus Dormibacteria bacterium]